MVPLLAGVAAGLIIVCGLRSSIRAGDYANYERLLKASLAVSAGNPQILFEMGNQKLLQADYPGAVDQYREALKLRPDVVSADRQRRQLERAGRVGHDGSVEARRRFRRRHSRARDGRSLLVENSTRDVPRGLLGHRRHRQQNGDDEDCENCSSHATALLNEVCRPSAGTCLPQRIQPEFGSKRRAKLDHCGKTQKASICLRSRRAT